jgi:hypothetical protein
VAAAASSASGGRLEAHQQRRLAAAQGAGEGGLGASGGDSLWPILGEHGLRPVTQVSIDRMWSALRFRPLKEGEVHFAGGRS